MVAPLLALAGSGLISAGIGYGLRKYVLNDPTPLELHEVGTDIIGGMAFPVIYGPVSGAVAGRIGTSAVARLATGAISGAASGLGTAAVEDVAEDVLRNQEIKLEPSRYPAYAVIGGISGAAAEGAVMGAQKLGSKFWIPKVGKVDLPDEKLGYWAGLYAQKGEQAKPIIGITKGGIKVGKPAVEITKEFFETTPRYLPKSAIETALTLDDLANFYRRIGAPDEATRLLTGYKMMIHSKNIKVPIDTPLDDVIRGSDRLGDVADDIAGWIKRQRNLEVYGSITQKMQMGRAMTRTPQDIDIVVPDAGKKAKDLLGILKQKLGGTVRISPTSSTMIERNINGNWVHMVDIHDKGSIISTILGGSPADEQIGFGFRSQPTVKSTEGVPVMQLSEQSIRKGTSTITPTKMKFPGIPETVYGVNPESHRVKDLYDFMEIEGFFSQQLKAQGKTGASKELSKLLDVFKSTRDPGSIAPKYVTQQAAKTVANIPVPNMFGFYYSTGSAARNVPQAVLGAAAASAGSKTYTAKPSQTSYSPGYLGGMPGVPMTPGYSSKPASSGKPSPPTAYIPKPSPPSSKAPSKPPSVYLPGYGGPSMMPSIPSPGSSPSPPPSPPSGSPPYYPPPDVFNPSPQSGSASKTPSVRQRFPQLLGMPFILPGTGRSGSKSEANLKTKWVSEWDILNIPLPGQRTQKTRSKGTKGRKRNA